MKVKKYHKKLSFRKKRGRKVLKTVIFALVVGVLVFVGYSVGGPLLEYLAGNHKSSSSSHSSADTSGENDREKDETPSDDTSSDDGRNDTFENAHTIPADAVLSELALKNACEKIKTEGYSGAVIELKDDTGIIKYQSQNEFAERIGAAEPDALNLDLIAEIIKEQGLKPIAKIYTLKDNTAPLNNGGIRNTYTVGSGRWHDADPGTGGKKWLNPYTADARTYIADLTKEIADAGFSAIIFDGLEFPRHLNQAQLHNDQRLSEAEALSLVIVQAQQLCEIPVFRSFDASELLPENATSSRYGGSPLEVEAENTLLKLDGKVLELDEDAMLEFLSNPDFNGFSITTVDNEAGQQASEIAKGIGFNTFIYY
ncbi:MAG: putative glycoside hydrolase [Oscillospiraceae bacterium]|nr:putative glycoside hydrolase [Oscillospiraceae bacterium]